MQRIILVLLMVAMTLAVTGTAMAQAPSADQLFAQMSQDLGGGCTLWFNSLVTCL